MANVIVDFSPVAFVFDTDIVTNGSFTTDTDWTKGAGATIAAGVLSYDGTQLSNSETKQTGVFSVGDRLVGTFTVSGISAGQVRLKAGGAVGPWVAANGTYTHTLIAASGTDMGVEADVNFVGDIDDLIIKTWGGRYTDPNLTALYNTNTRAGWDNSTDLPGAIALDQVALDPWLECGGAIFDKDTGLSGPSEPVAGLAFTPVIAPNQHTDYHFRLWIIPPFLSLANPQLDTNIGFRLWNTWSDTETIASILVSGSNVLSFDIGPGTQLHDGEYRAANMQISEGEPTIEAEVSFTTENLSGLMKVFAAVSDTFNLIPDVPVRERWVFLTDILTTHNGQEQRVSLRPKPRMELDFTVQIIDTAQRLKQYELLTKNIQVQSLVPFYQYATHLTGDTAIGGTKVFFDPTRTNMRAGEFIVAVNPKTEELFISRVNTVDVDGATVNSASSFSLDKSWVAAPAFNCTLNDDSGLTMRKLTGSLRVQAKTFTEPSTLRPGQTAVVNTLNGLPVLERRPLIPAKEQFAFRRDIIDNDTGARDINSSDLHPRVSGDRKFVIQRVQQPLEMDYWRKFFDLTRGAWKPFLLSTYFPDLTLSPGQAPLLQGSSGFTIEEGYYSSLYFPYETWKHIEIAFPGGELHHARVISASIQLDGTAAISFTPALPVDSAYVSPTRISYLTKLRGLDKVNWSHHADVTYVTMGVTYTDEG
jgi:hypothetical protein